MTTETTQLVRQIVDILSDAKPNLENALMKTKVLFHRLGEKIYIEWINKELNGYSDDDEVPSYRVIPSTTQITVTDGFTRHSDMLAPTNHLSDKIKKWLKRNEFRESISSLESLAHAEGGSLSRPLPPEYWGEFEKALTSGFHVEEAHCAISQAHLKGVLTQIRSRLLDFVLELEERLPPDVSDEEAREISKDVQVGNLLNNAMFGPNTTIVIGDNNTQTLNFSVVQKDDFASLATYLESQGVQNEDISALQDAIKNDEDEVDHELKQYGSNVKAWLKNMLHKAGDAGWKLGTGAAGSLLATALNSYYGWF